MAANGGSCIPLLVAVLCFCASIASSDEQCIEVIRNVNVTAVPTEVVSSHVTGGCLSMTWYISTADRSSQWIAIDILEFSGPSNASVDFKVSYSSTGLGAYHDLVQGFQKRLYTEVTYQPRLMLTSFPTDLLTPGSSDYRFRARITLANEIDCGEHLLCNMNCIDSSNIACDGQAQCEQAVDEINCAEECGQTEYNLVSGEPVSITFPTQSEADFVVCQWGFNAPQGSPILVRFTEFAFITHEWYLDIASAQSISEQPGALSRRAESVAPIMQTYKANSVWIIFGYDRNRMSSSEVSSGRFEVIVINDTVACGDGEFLCDSGIQCTGNSSRCDGFPDCDDFSDELGCPGFCGPDKLTCTLGSTSQCVAANDICNGRRDCDDFRDEARCSSSCGNQFVHLTPDTTHRLSSPVNPPSTDYPNPVCVWFVTAPSGTRLLIKSITFNVNIVSTLSVGEGSRINTSRVIWQRTGGTAPTYALSETDKIWVAFNGKPFYYPQSGVWTDSRFILELSVFEDSVNCTGGDHLVPCKNGYQCIDAANVCDGVIHCHDLSDETACDDQCSDSAIQCENTNGRNVCVPGTAVCNGTADCANYMDETLCNHCGNVSTIVAPSLQPYIFSLDYRWDMVEPRLSASNCLWFVTASPGHHITVKITDFVGSDGTSLLFGGGTVYRSNTLKIVAKGIRSRLFLVSPTDNMWITFTSLVSPEDRFTLEIQQFEPVECTESEFSCSSGIACIPRSQECDGTPHCPNLDDELACDFCAPEAPGKLCDGNADCVDLMDEANCLPCGESFLVMSNSSNSSYALTSENFPMKYPDNSLCVWYVTAEEGAVVLLSFDAFNLERSYDFFTIGNGHAPSDTSAVIVKLTGEFGRARIFTKGNRAWLEFRTDHSVTKPGFSLAVTQETAIGQSCAQDETACEDRSSGLVCLSDVAKCDGFPVCADGSDERKCGDCGPDFFYVYDDPVTLTTPMYPNNYPDRASCSWLIIGERETYVSMRIHTFALENGYDFLTVSLEDVEGGSVRQLFKLTGRDITRRTLAWGWYGDENLRLTFTSDHSSTDSGFNITLAKVQNITDDFDADLSVICKEDEFYCGDDGMCIVKTAECNGYVDCINYADEEDCSEVFCPGSYKCNNFNAMGSVITTTTTTMAPPFHTTEPPYPPDDGSGDGEGFVLQTQCIPRTQVCDGMQHCKWADDETKCDTKRCPPGCACRYNGQDLAVTCASGWNYSTLADMALTTHTLQLSGMNISRLEPGAFKALSDLQVLSLSNNNLTEIHHHTFDGLENLLWLDLSNTSLTQLGGYAMEELSSLRGITIFDVPLLGINDDAFNGLSQLKTLIIVRNIKGLPPIDLEENAFRGLDALKELYVDDHRLCCFFRGVECKTLEPEPPLFMCSDLMPKLVLKVFMWILGVSALVGNVFVMIWRSRENTEGRPSRIVHSFLVFNLAVSDAFMGLYMLTIAGADVYYGNEYFEVSGEWRASAVCQMAGFVSIIASEASVFFLTLISIDRFLAIVFPFSSHRIRPKSARVIAICIWVITVLVALVPTILATDVTSDLYGLSDVCIGLPLTTKVTEYMTVPQTVDAGGAANITVGIPTPVETRASWFFSIALFLGVNLLCFTVIFACYVAIFSRVRTSAKAVHRHKKRDDEVRMAIKMAAIITTDFICWVPVIIMGILSQTRLVQIPPEAYAWIVVFILPINSSLNPYLYTISDLCSRQRRATASSSTKGNDMALQNSDTNRMTTISTLTLDELDRKQ